MSTFAVFVGNLFSSFICIYLSLKVVDFGKMLGCNNHYWQWQVKDKSAQLPLIWESGPEIKVDPRTTKHRGKVVKNSTLSTVHDTNIFHSRLSVC